MKAGSRSFFDPLGKEAGADAFAGAAVTDETDIRDEEMACPG